MPNRITALLVMLFMALLQGTTTAAMPIPAAHAGSEPIGRHVAHMQESGAPLTPAEAVAPARRQVRSRPD